MGLTIRDHPGDDVDHQVQQFLAQRNVRFVIAFSGGADDNTSLTEHVVDQLASEFFPHLDPADIANRIRQGQKTFLAEMVSDILKPLRGYHIGVLTGGTKYGVPAVATEVAKALGFATIGVYPLAAKTGKDRVLSNELLDLQICVHPHVGKSRWGDEAAIFTKLLNCAVVIGGGAGTMVEVSHLIKRNEDKDLPVKFILPVVGTGGTADRVMSFPGKPDTMSRCLPPKPLTNGTEVCEFLRRHVFLDDLFD